MSFVIQFSEYSIEAIFYYAFAAVAVVAVATAIYQIVRVCRSGQRTP